MRSEMGKSKNGRGRGGSKGGGASLKRNTLSSSHHLGAWGRGREVRRDGKEGVVRQRGCRKKGEPQDVMTWIGRESLN